MGASDNTINGETRRTPEWRRAFRNCKAQVSRRSRGWCEWCDVITRQRQGGRHGGHEFHHLLPVDHPMANDASYVVYLCRDCHRHVHKAENYIEALRERWLLLNVPWIVLQDFLVRRGYVTVDEITYLREERFQ